MQTNIPADVSCRLGQLYIKKAICILRLGSDLHWSEGFSLSIFLLLNKAIAHGISPMISIVLPKEKLTGSTPRACDPVQRLV
ncbi:MAG TPA: hypothetical protein PKN70_13380, partial [Smithellaceae bacterium]|nr:hypothetical protein [Smithellaceae bacterium]